MKKFPDPRKFKIGTLLTGGIIIIIVLMVSASFYSNYLTTYAQRIINSSTSRIFDVLTLQRDIGELFNALEDLNVIIESEDLDSAEDNIEGLQTRAKETVQRGLKKEIFNEAEASRAMDILDKASNVTTTIITIKKDSTLQSPEQKSSDNFVYQETSMELDNQFMRLRNIDFEMQEVVHDVIIRSDDEYRDAMRLVQSAQKITWIVIAVSLGLALVLGYFLVKSVKQIFDLKNEFVNIIAHDLRNPVTAITGYLEIMQSKKNKKISDVGDDFLALTVSAQKLRIQIGNLLEVGRSEAGRLKINIETIPPYKIIEESILREKAFAEMSGVKIVYVNNEKQDVLIYADKNKLSDVLDNLISNAIKYNKKDGTVTITTKTADKYFQISVTDTGEGIPEDQKQKIFKRYSRLDTDKEKKVSGTGLGLYTVKLAMDQMKGRVEFESQIGKGTTFSVFLNKANKSKQ